MSNKISTLSKILLVTSAVLLAISIFVPIWQIDLDAPQYPEGLNLKIYADNLAGDVDIINGLNHYIGMKTLHAADFIEFTILKYIISFFAAFAIFVAIVGKRKFLVSLFSFFVIFGIVAMIDFWRWEYNYGHDLNPHAAIIVPGMAYQPPLIGFKQLLNFGAYSVPDIGGWMFIVSGLLMLVAVLKEYNLFPRKKPQVDSNALLGFLLILFLSGCGNSEPAAINLNKDNCDNCKMSIADKRFACEILTEKGRTYKFDDVRCLVKFHNENKAKMSDAHFYANDFLSPNDLLPSSQLTFVKGDDIGSPMGGDVATFANRDSATVYLNKWNAIIISWEEIK
jgi:copper chaperone NosL